MPKIYNIMFNLNESNQFFFSNSPTDMRVGVNSMCGRGLIVQIAVSNALVVRK